MQLKHNNINQPSAAAAQSCQTLWDYVVRQKN